MPDEIGLILQICIILEYGDCRDLKRISMRLLRPLFCINQRRCTDHSRHARSVIKAVARTTNAKIIENATLFARILIIFVLIDPIRRFPKFYSDNLSTPPHCRPRDERGRNDKTRSEDYDLLEKRLRKRKHVACTSLDPLRPSPLSSGWTCATSRK